MKKVLFVTSLYYPHVGGIETMVRELASLYKSKGIESVVLTKKWPTSLCVYENFEEVDIYRIISARTDNQFIEVIDWIKVNSDLIRADIIHVVGIRRPMPLIALLLGRLWSVPVICTIAGGDIPDKIDPDPGKVWEQGLDFIPQTLMQADIVNCVSNALSEDLKKLIPDLKGVETLYAGIDFSNIRNSVKQEVEYPYIFSFRRLEPSKGVDILINAFNLIKNNFPDLKLIIAGEGSDENKLKILTNNLKLNERVHFIGTVDIINGISYLKGASLTVVPSLSEGGGLVNIEAQAAGCPVIASRVGGIPEYISDGQSGILFEPGDCKDLAEKITQVLTNANLREKLINNGIEHAKMFDWDIIGEQYISLYKNCIRKYDPNLAFKPWSVLTEKLWQKLNID